MSEQVLEPKVGFAGLFKSAPPVAEEPVETPEEIKDEKAEEITPEAPAVVSEDTKTEDAEKTEAPEDGFTVIDIDEKTEKPQEDFGKIVAQLKEQNKALLDEKEKLTQRDELDPRVKQLDAWLKSGGDFNKNFWELQNKDYTKVNFSDSQSSIDALSDKLRYVDGLDEEEVKYHLEKNYPILSGVQEAEDDGETRDERMKLRMEVKPALPKLEEVQKKAKIPNVDHNRQQEYDRQLNVYRAEASSKFDEIKFLDIEIDAEHKLRLPMAGEAEKFARSIVTEPENQTTFFIDRYTDPQGKTDYGKFKTEVYYLENRQKIEKAIFMQGKSAQKKEMLAEMDSEPTTKAAIAPNQGSNSKSGFANINFKRQ